MNVFFIFGFTILQLVFVLLASAILDFNLFFRCFLNFLRNQQEQSVFFEAFSGGFILLELEMKSFLPIVFKLFWRAGFAHCLKMFSRFFPFAKFRNKGQWHFGVPHFYQEILFDECHLCPNLFQLSLASILSSQQIYFPALSLCVLRKCCI